MSLDYIIVLLIIMEGSPIFTNTIFLGSRCEICDDGFYGDPLGEYGPPKQCQPCQCNGHMDQNAVSNCDRRTGECRKCLYHSTGPKCENCEDGYYHSYPTEPCQGMKK